MSNLEGKKIINKQKKKLMKTEHKLLNKKENIYIKNKILPIKTKVEQKIPQGMIDTFQKAFEKGFYYVFEKGTSIIEKSYSTEHLKNQADINKYRLSKEINNRNFREIDKKIQKGIFINKGISTAEGAILGLIGIGLPDIPIFIGVILKTIYEICLNYGFEYESDEEKIFILNVICTGLSKGELKLRYSAEADKIGYNIDSKLKSTFNIDEMIKATSGNLAQSMMIPKFIQGMPIIGIYGGISNYKLIRDIGKIASVKYKKRFLTKL